MNCELCYLPCRKEELIASRMKKPVPIPIIIQTNRIAFRKVLACPLCFDKYDVVEDDGINEAFARLEVELNDWANLLKRFEEN